MPPKTLRPVWFFTAAAVLLLVATAHWWLGDQEAVTVATIQPTPVPVAESIVAAIEPTLPEVGSGSEAAPVTTSGFARRMTRVPDTRPTRDNDTPSTDIRDISAGNIGDLIQANLENALNDDMASAYFVVQARRVCGRFGDTPGDLEKRIERTNRKVERDIKRGRELPTGARNDLPWSATGDKEENRAHLESWYDACQNVQSMFTQDLRQQLELLALNGDVMAGYLYASWPLDQLDTGKAFDQQYRWEELARGFSRANMDRGEVAGLMAFAQSYMNGWFTVRNGDLALAFSIAALNCGFETTSSRNFLSNRVEHLAASEDPADQQRLLFALTESERLGSLCSP